ncbi:MAG: PilZ domain-containing protein [Terriglobia bacterium]|jgi:hypothetical protein
MEPSSVNKRSQRRVAVAIPVQVRGLDAAGLEYDDSTTALEVSRRGLSFLTKRNLAIFATLTVVIPGRGPVRPEEGATDFFTEATVVRSVKEDEEFYRVGVRFMGATLPMYSAEGL